MTQSRMSGTFMRCTLRCLHAVSKRRRWRKICSIQLAIFRLNSLPLQKSATRSRCALRHPRPLSADSKTGRTAQAHTPLQVLKVLCIVPVYSESPRALIFEMLFAPERLEQALALRKELGDAAEAALASARDRIWALEEDLGRASARIKSLEGGDDLKHTSLLELCDEAAGN